MSAPVLRVWRIARDRVRSRPVAALVIKPGMILGGVIGCTAGDSELQCLLTYLYRAVRERPFVSIVLRECVYCHDAAIVRGRDPGDCPARGKRVH
ncbi:hypothetical protein GCM10027297_11880 [Parahaliea aestuarii]